MLSNINFLLEELCVSRAEDVCPAFEFTFDSKQHGTRGPKLIEHWPQISAGIKIDTKQRGLIGRSVGSVNIAAYVSQLSTVKTSLDVRSLRTFAVYLIAPERNCFTVSRFTVSRSIVSATIESGMSHDPRS